MNMFNRNVEAAQLYTVQKNIPFIEGIYVFKSLNDFRRKVDITFTAGAYDLSNTSDYGHYASLFTSYNGAYRRIDILTDSGLAERRSNMLAPRLSEHPAAVINGTDILIYPTDITAAEFTYLKLPSIPVYDYYLTSYGEQIALAAGQTYTLQTGEIGSAGQTSGSVSSTTVELEWSPLYHIEFANELLKMVGVNLKDEQVRQYASAAQQDNRPI